MRWCYLLALFVSAAGMVTLDWRYTLAFFYDARRTAVVLATGFIVFALWDAVGIGLGIFFSGHSHYMSGIYLAPEFPIEEVGFLLFLCYFALVIYRLGETRWRPIL